MKKLQNISRSFFYCFVFFLPFSIDAWIYGPDLFLSGFFNPYITHFVYLSDLFYMLGLLFFFLAKAIQTKEQSLPKVPKNLDNKLFYSSIIFIFSYILSLFLSAEQNNSVFYIFRALQFFIFFLLSASNFLNPNRILKYFVISVFLQSVLGILQFTFQNDLGLHFIGEPTLDSSLKLIAKINIFNHDLLRSYGTLPHPNILGAYIVFGIFFLHHLFPKKKWKFFTIFTIFSLALFFTFSRGAVMALILGILIFFKKNNFVTFSISLGIFMLTFLFAPINTLIERLIQYETTFKMFLSNPLGIGAGNFTLAMTNYFAINPYPWEIQPVHNAFLLVLTELGILGFLAFIYMLYSKLRMLLAESKKMRTLAFSLFMAIIVFSITDHYLISSYSGQFLFWLMISINPTVGK